MKLPPYFSPASIFRPTFFIALVFALLSSDHINNQYHPLRLNFDDSQLKKGLGKFELEKPEPLHFEVDYNLRDRGNIDNTIILWINGRRAQTIPTKTNFLNERIRFTIPQSKLIAGENQLTVQIESGEANIFSLNVRIMNYLGISPNFPKAYVVDDNRPDEFEGMQKFLRPGAKFLTVFLAGFILFQLFFKLAQSILPFLNRVKPGKAALLFVFPVLIPASVKIYSVTTPFKILFPFESLLGVCLIYFLLILGVLLAVRWKKIAYPAAIVVLLTLGTAEISMRVYNLFYPSHIFYTESYNRYRSKHLTYYHGFPHNSQGFHDIEHSIKKPGNSFRIVAIGDSFAYGVVPYKNNFLTLLEDLLKQDHPAREVINMGISALEPRDYLSLLANEGLRYDPDMVMVFFFIGNDFEETGKKAYEYSFLATFFHYVYIWTQIEKEVFPPPAPNPEKRSPPILKSNNYRDDLPSFEYSVFMGIEASRSRIFIKSNSKFFRSAERAFYYLKQMQALCRDRDIEFLTVLIPDEVQVNSSLQHNVIRAHGLKSEDFDFLRPNRWLAKNLAGANIPMIDLTEIFIKESEKISLYKPRNTHWNIPGNQLAAKILHQKISGYIGGESTLLK